MSRPRKTPGRVVFDSDGEIVGIERNLTRAESVGRSYGDDWLAHRFDRGGVGQVRTSVLTSSGKMVKP